MKKDHFIFVQTPQKAALRKKFETSDATISDALNFKRHSLLCRRIRSASVNMFNGLYF